MSPNAAVVAPYLPVPSQENTFEPLPSVVYPYGVKSMSKGTTIYDALKRIGTAIEEVPLPGPSPYVKPSSILYTFDGKPKRWDVSETHASVGVVLYNKTWNSFLLVRQFRPPVYATAARTAVSENQPPPNRAAGFTYELCAGLVDKSKPIKHICREEIAEEVGYQVPLENIHELGASLSSAGVSGSLHHMFYAEVDDSMRVDGGGGLVDHGECIEVLALPLESVLPFILDSSLPKSPGLMFGLLWAHQRIKESGRLSGPEPLTQMPNPNMTEELVLKSVIPS